MGKRTLLRSNVKSLSLIALAAILALVVVALNTAKAHADEPDSSEAGTAYISYQFGESGDKVGPYRTSTTTSDVDTYNARVNISDGAVMTYVKVMSNDVDITGECKYDGRSSLVHIPAKYAYDPVFIDVAVDEASVNSSFKTRVSIISGINAEDSISMVVDVLANAKSIEIPVSSAVKAVTQDSLVLDKSEWSQSNGIVTIKDRSPLSGSISVYLDSYGPDVNSSPSIEKELKLSDHPDEQTLKPASNLYRSAKSPMLLAASARSTQYVSAYITCQNQGPGEWDYTDYTVTWNGNSARVYCCEHGVPHAPVTRGDGGWITLQMTLNNTAWGSKYETSRNDSTIYYRQDWTDYYSLYVNFGSDQDVDGSWSTSGYSTSLTQRYGWLGVNKKSSQPTVSLTDYYKYDATYNVYSDAGCNSWVASVQCNQWGAGSVNLPSGRTYYVREATAPQGFEYSSEVKSVYVRPDVVSSVDIYNTPKSATVIYIADGVEVERHTGVPIGSTHRVSDGATVKARKSGCTPGFDGWYTNSSYTSSKFTSKVMGYETLTLYARNRLTLNYDYSYLSDHTQFDRFYRRPAQTLDEAVAASIALPPSKIYDYGTTVTLLSRTDVFAPTIGLTDGTDSPYWNTLRARYWNTKSNMTGSNIHSITLRNDVTLYVRYEKAPTDGVTDNRS